VIVTGLHLSRLRAIETAEFRFRAGFNLIVGVNGVGKSTVLDALRVCMSRALPKATGVRGKPITFEPKDIRSGFPFMDATMFLDLGGEQFQYSRLEWRETVAQDDSKNVEALRREILDAERLRDRPRSLLRALAESQDLPDSDNFAPEESAWRKQAMGLSSSPLGVFFSTNRSVLTVRGAATSKSKGGKSAAYADALVARPWNVRELADWMKVQLTLSKEVPLAAQHVAALQNAAHRFLPDCTGLRPGDEEESTLVLEKAGTSLDVRQLSDGERGVLSMVLDLSRRLSQANAGASDPLGEGQAVVLIDEIDLHLHPKWQRQIVGNLTAAFPRCQFIATTHSPQVIGEVDRDRIQIISDGQVYSPTHSYGVDSSRILEEVMEAPSRDPEISHLQSEISQAIGRTDFREARELLGKLIERLELRESDPYVTHLRTLIDFAEGNE
jgi:predicted ATP-binding protein involved in virulence